MSEINNFVFDLEAIKNGSAVSEKAEKPKKVKEPKELKQIPDNRPRLPKSNRTVVCNFCEADKILNPEQYQAYFDFYGDEEKINREFICKTCEVKAKENPFRFWTEHSPLVRKLCKNIKVAFEIFQRSERFNEDVLALQNMVNGFLAEAYIAADKYEFISEKQLPVALRIKNIPFVDTIILQPYEQNKILIP